MRIAKANTGDARERDIERLLIKRVLELGGQVRKVSWIGRRGAPDRLILLPGRTIWVELKRPRGGRLSAAQIAELDLLQRCGCEAYVVTCEEEIDRVLGSNGCRSGETG